MKTRFAALALVLAFGVLGMLYTSSEAQAGNCRTCLSYNVGTPTYVAPHVIPAYGHSGFLQAYPKLLEVQRTDVLYSSAQYLQNEALMKALETIDKLNAQLQQRGGPVGGGNTGAALPSDVEEVLRGIPKVQFASSSPGGVQSVVKEKCLSCHNGSKHVLDLSDLTKLSEKDKVAVRDSVADGTMPPKGKPPLTPEEVRDFRHFK